MHSTDLIKNKDKDIVKTLFKGFAITISIAVAYYVLTMTIPMIGGQFRVANALQYLKIVMPHASFAIALAMFYVLFTQGKLLFWFYWINPLLNLVCGLGAYYVNKRINKEGSILKGFSILLVQTLIVSAWVSFAHAMVANTVINQIDLHDFWVGFFSIKTPILFLSIISGYPLYRMTKPFIDKVMKND